MLIYLPSEALIMIKKESERERERDRERERERERERKEALIELESALTRLGILFNVE